MTCIILQARLDSTRLPRKALLDLAGKPVILRVMENLRRIPSDRYILACDTASEETFAPLAEMAGFTCISGPKEDVLERFCMVIRKTGAKTVLRATGDNPFLFADAAEARNCRLKKNRFIILRIPVCLTAAESRFSRHLIWWMLRPLPIPPMITNMWDRPSTDIQTGLPA